MLANSIFTAHRDELNKQSNKKKADGDKQELMMVFSSFTDIPISLDSIAKKNFPSEWRQITVEGKPLTSNQIHSCKNKIKENRVC